MTFCVDVVTADTSTMRNRGLAFAFTSSPYIITAFGGPKAAETIYADNWRWGFGAWAIVLPVVAAPLIIMMALGKRKAQKNGLAPRLDSGRTWQESLWYYFIEFDGKQKSPNLLLEQCLIKILQPWVSFSLLLASFSSSCR